MRHVASCGALKPTRFTRESFIRKALPEYSKDASPKRKGDSSWPKFTLDLRPPRRSSGPYKQGLPYRILLADIPSRHTRPRPTLRQLPAFRKSKPSALPLSKQSPYLGPSQSGGSIWSDTFKEEAIRKNTYWSWWTSSPNG